MALIREGVAARQRNEERELFSDMHSLAELLQRGEVIAHTPQLVLQPDALLETMSQGRAFDEDACNDTQGLMALHFSHRSTGKHYPRLARPLAMAQLLQQWSDVCGDRATLRRGQVEIKQNFASVSNKHKATVTPSQRDNTSFAVLSRSDSPTFSAENIQRPDNVPCGSYKCFFGVRSHPDIGYLVTPSKMNLQHPKSEAAWLKVLDATWDFAQRLEKEYGIEHFLLGAPETISVSSKLAQHLRKDRYEKGSKAYIQKVKKAPFPVLKIPCNDDKAHPFQSKLIKFLPFVKQKKEFASEFKKGWYEMRRMLRQETCLINDFQLLLDTKGKLYHIDLDRCFEVGDTITERNVGESYTDECFETLDGIEAAILQYLEGGNNQMRRPAMLPPFTNKNKTEAIPSRQR